MKSKEKGDLAVAKAISYFVEQGYEVLLPIGDKKKYDLVTEKDGVLKRVQCKFTTHRPEGSYVVPLRVMGGNRSYYSANSYKTGDFDVLFALTGDGDVYVIPSEITNKLKNSLTLGNKCDKYKM